MDDHRRRPNCKSTGGLAQWALADPMQSTFRSTFGYLTSFACTPLATESFRTSIHAGSGLPSVP